MTGKIYSACCFGSVKPSSHFPISPFPHFQILVLPRGIVQYSTIDDVVVLDVDPDLPNSQGMSRINSEAFILYAGEDSRRTE